MQIEFNLVPEMKLNFSNMRIGARLGLAFGVVLALLSSVALVGITHLNALNDTITAAVDFNGNESNLISQALGSAQDAATAMRNLIILNDVPRMTVQKQAFDQSLATYNVKGYSMPAIGHRNVTVPLRVLAGVE